MRKLKSLGSRGAQGAPSCEKMEVLLRLEPLQRNHGLSLSGREGLEGKPLPAEIFQELVFQMHGKRILERTVPWGLGNGHQRK